MSTHTILPPPAAVPWRAGLAGEFPGQRSFVELGAAGGRMDFCWCPPTAPERPFLMGSPPEEANRSDDETQRPVPIPQGFWLAQHPVNQQQWQAVLGTNPSQRGKGELHPVDTMSWDDAKEFCKKTGLCLPTEAQWEYACRAGTSTPFGIGDGASLNAQLANFDGGYPYGSGRDGFKWLYRERTLPQGCFPPNAWGLHDMHGQLWEWCEDKYDDAGRARVLRGGGWITYGWRARSAFRYGYAPGYRYAGIGFRPCPSSISPAGEAGGRKSSAQRG